MFATLPKGCKPSKMLSRDKHRPILCSANLRCHEGAWEIVGTDSFKLGIIPLEIDDRCPELGLTEGAISAEALKAVEKSGHFATTDTTVTPLSRFGVPDGPVYGRTADIGQFPRPDQLFPDRNGEIVVGLDAKYLYELAQALGSNVVYIQFTEDKAGRINPLRPVTVKTSNGVGIQMTVR